MSTIIRDDSVLISPNLTTTSTTVAEKFGKRHDTVLRAVDNLEVPDGFNRRNFVSVEYRDAKGEQRRAVEMTRDGFMLLVMGFTGKKAMGWKVRFLEAFNEMERQLRGTAIPALNPPPSTYEAPYIRRDELIAALEGYASDVSGSIGPLQKQIDDLRYLSARLAHLANTERAAKRIAEEMRGRS